MADGELAVFPTVDIHLIYTYRNLFSTTPIQLYTPTIIDTIANETMVTNSLRYKKLWLTFPESSGVRLLQANQP